MEQQPTFTLTDEQGNETTFYVLFTFDNGATGKSYMAFTDNSVDQDGGIRVAAACFDPNDEELRLLPIQTEQEWAMVERALNEYQHPSAPEE